MEGVHDGGVAAVVARDVACVYGRLGRRVVGELWQGRCMRAGPGQDFDVR